MTQNPAFTDEDLTAFLDNELPQDLSDQIAAAVADDPALAARIARLTVPLGDLRLAYDSLLTIAPSMPELPEPAALWQRRDIAAGLVVGLLFGAAGAKLLLSPAPRDWMDFVAAYQALYVPETLAEIQITEAEVAAQLNALSAVVRLDLVRVRDGSDLVYKRGQLLGFDGAQLVQLAFQTADGSPVALCILRDVGQSARPFADRPSEGMQAVAWARDGYGFFLIGATDAQTLRAAAVQFDSVI